MDGWFLIDAGHDSHIKRLLNAIKEKIGPKGVISHFALTHGHVDHVAALPKLLKIYPDAKVLCHSEEAPFILHQKSYTGLKGDHPSWKLFKHFTKKSKAIIPQDCIERIDEGYSLKGQLQAYHLPGHTLGSVGWLHTKTGSFMIGDVVMRMSALFSHRPSLTLPLLPATPFIRTTKESVKHMGDIDFTTAYPCHDDGQGVSKGDLMTWAERKLSKNEMKERKHRNNDNDE
jgi:glyoxylase-like metal-dependent hydrolase (beta-lactamase superfamily II)